MIKVIVPLLIAALFIMGAVFTIQLKTANEKIEQLRHVIHTQHGTIKKSDERNARLIELVEKTIKQSFEWKQKVDECYG